MAEHSTWPAVTMAYDEPGHKRRMLKALHLPEHIRCVQNISPTQQRDHAHLIIRNLFIEKLNIRGADIRHAQNLVRDLSNVLKMRGLRVLNGGGR